jgi:signal transduction histidine kinase
MSKKSTTGAPPTLSGLRLRLTAWYVGTFLIILLLLGVGLFATITRRFDADLDDSLGANTAALATATETPPGATIPLLVPDRQLVVFDSSGHAIVGEAESWLGRFAARAATTGASSISHRTEPEKILRAHARPFRTTSGTLLVAVAVADEVELEDKYASLIAVSGAAALLSLVLVGIGGWIVARQSTEPVERAITQMRRFMADAAHELRTPLTVVRSRAEVALQRTREPAEYEETLHTVEREASRMGRIVEDLLMLARADAGERPIERRRVFVDDITLEAAEAARALAERRGVRLELGDFEEAPAMGDAALLRQLALILLDNAIKFSRQGDVVRVDIRTVGGAAVLTVADEGVGIPAEQLAHVFERFYRGDAARTRSAAGVSDGAGLGLSIAQWIVDEHGGTIRIASEAGQGTRAIVQLPVAGSESLSSS